MPVVRHSHRKEVREGKTLFDPVSKFAVACVALGFFLLGSVGPAAAANAANQVALENSLPGTADWRLDTPATNREIEGYASATSVNGGDIVSLYVNTAAPTFQLEVFRMGWYAGLGARRVHGPLSLPGKIQVIPRPDPTTGLVDCNWVESFALETRDSVTGEPWRTGIYLARLTESKSNKQAYIIFVVRDDAQRPDILFQLPVTTYQAYNFWGGKSLYNWGSGSTLPWASSNGTPATKVSFNRPYAASPNQNAAYGNGAGEFLTNVQPTPQYPISAAGWDYNMVRWLEKEKYDVGYITNIDTHRAPERLRNTDIFMSHGHDEYWTWSMRANVEAARDAGVNLAFCSANSAYWQIRLEPSPANRMSNRIMVAYKNAARDPFDSDSDPSNDKFLTVLFRDPPVSKPEESLIGIQYFMSPVDGDIVVAEAPHWVFRGTGLSDQQRLPGLLGYEVDRRFGSEPPNTITLASSPTVNLLTGNSGRNSEMTLYSVASGAAVFGAGTIQWSWGLDDFNAPDLRTSRLHEAASTITRNVLGAFGAHPNANVSTDTPVTTCLRLKALSEVNENPWASAAEIDVLDQRGEPLDKADWVLAGYDSEELVADNGLAANAIDGSSKTIWHTQWSPTSKSMPHNIDINLGRQEIVSGLQYLPRQSGGMNGTIADFEIYTSDDCATWKRIAAGTWPATTARKTAIFNTAPTVAIVSPTSGGHTTNDLLTLSGTANDAEDGDLSSNLDWVSDTDGTLGQGSTLTVHLSEGTHTITASVIDSGGRTTTQSVRISVTRVDPASPMPDPPGPPPANDGDITDPDNPPGSDDNSAPDPDPNSAVTPDNGGQSGGGGVLTPLFVLLLLLSVATGTVRRHGTLARAEHPPRPRAPQIPPFA